MAFTPGWAFLCPSKQLLLARAAKPVQNIYWGVAVSQGGRCGGEFSSCHLTLPGFHLFAVANIGPGRRSSETLGSPFPASPAGPRLPGADGHLAAAAPEGGEDATLMGTWG